MQRTDLVAFLDTGVAMLGASADADGVPEAFRVWGAAIDDRGRLRALVSSHSARTFHNVHAGAPVCLLFTDVTTFESVQVKGAAVGDTTAPGPDEIALMERYDETFGAALQQIGHPLALLETLRPRSVFAVTVEIEQLYDQTPGPTAGRPIEPAPRG